MSTAAELELEMKMEIDPVALVHLLGPCDGGLMSLLDEFWDQPVTVENSWRWKGKCSWPWEKYKNAPASRKFRKCPRVYFFVFLCKNL
ncbi:hypothetical protein LINGRAPRIM_LOCUS2708 [Linum grandiflorum]